LRYELRLFNPSRQLGIPGGIQATRLSEPRFANQLISHWVREYFHIVKNRKLIFPCDIQSQHDFSNFLSLAGCMAIGGESELHYMVNSLSLPASRYPQKIKGDIHRAINNLHTNLRLVKSGELEAELDRCVMLAGMHGL